MPAVSRSRCLDSWRLKSEERVLGHLLGTLTGTFSGLLSLYVCRHVCLCMCLYAFVRLGGRRHCVLQFTFGVLREAPPASKRAGATDERMDAACAEAA